MPTSNHQDKREIEIEFILGKISEFLTFHKDYLKDNLNSFNEVMGDSFNDSNKSSDVKIITRRFNTACDHLDKSAEQINLLLEALSSSIPEEIKINIKNALIIYKM